MLERMPELKPLRASLAQSELAHFSAFVFACISGCSGTVVL